MMLLDTNIISEMMKQFPDPIVMDWIDHQEVTHLFISTVTIAEISYGLNVLPEGCRRTNLEHALNKTIVEAFTGRILTFNEPASYLYGKMMGHRKKRGQPLSIPDGQIAAIAKAHHAAVVTRNIRDFTNCELLLINPFEDPTHRSHLSLL